MRNGPIYNSKVDLGLGLTISMSFGDFIYFQGLYRKTARVIKPYEFKTCPERNPTEYMENKTLEDLRSKHLQAGPTTQRGGHGRALG